MIRSDGNSKSAGLFASEEMAIERMDGLLDTETTRLIVERDFPDIGPVPVRCPDCSGEYGLVKIPKGNRLVDADYWACVSCGRRWDS